MLLSHHQKAGKNHDIKIAYSSLENVAQLKYFGTTVINQSFIEKEIKRRLNLGNIQSRTFCLLAYCLET
jgi:hypothetical protein